MYANGSLSRKAKDTLVYHRNAFHALLKSSMWYIGPCSEKVCEMKSPSRKTGEGVEITNGFALELPH